MKHQEWYSYNQRPPAEALQQQALQRSRVSATALPFSRSCSCMSA